MENHLLFNGYINYKSPFSIAMFVYQGVFIECGAPKRYVNVGL